METWRLIATALLAAGGLLLVLVTMAKVRDRVSSGGPVAVAGAIAFTILVLLCLLTVTVLPATVAWGAVVVVGATASVMLLAG
ncbi:hypothetical protein [Actinokineospora iranica]|uniref:Uncharacterized protein n=1 Tax=Actinokineospora iranica TaxID=1271860 RepID=A0A1G6Y4F6_9PSEU|nr:hypothetical protein [Actinokineospora iranica]SDD85374.1 hypothetical protein SAMN05216174_12023 [Actinokineospora iranica]